MDIRCPACATFYELDEAKVAPGGTNIRCSACGQVFRVRNADATASSCMVRRSTTGEITHFDDLQTLQRWIADGKIQPDDLISRTGKSWRHLYEIGEIAAWFADASGLTGRVARTSGAFPARQDAAATLHLHAPQSTPPHLGGNAVPRVGQPTVASPGLTPRPTAITPASLTPSVPARAVEAPIRRRPAKLTPQDPASEWSLGDTPLQSHDPGFVRARGGEDTAGEVRRSSPLRTLAGAVLLLLVGASLGVMLSRRDALFPEPSASDRSAATGLADDAPVVAPTPPVPEPPTPAAAVPTAAEAVPEGSAAIAALPPTPAPSAEPSVVDPAVEPEERSSGYEALMSDANDALDAGDAARALALFERAADRSDRAEAHTGMARAYQSLGRTDLAAARYRRALGRNDRYAPAWLGLADVLRADGDSAGAQEAYEQVVRIVPSGSMRDRAERALEALR